MFIGHFGLAFAAKKAAPRTSLGTLIMAAQFLDLIWPIFLLLGLERVEIDPGNTAVTPLNFVSYPLSHSLLAAVGWACLFAGIYWFTTHYRAGAITLGLLIFSHWFLDLISHRPDLPLYPGSDVMVGLGLWNSRPATILVEGFIFLAGIALYRLATDARDAVGNFSFRTLVFFLALLYVMNLFGPPPPNTQVLEVLALAQWLFVPWAYWIDRHRVSVLLA